VSTRFMTEAHQMRVMAGRFDVHAQTVEDEARRMWASSLNIAGAGWSGQAQATSYDTIGQVNQAFPQYRHDAAWGARRAARRRHQLRGARAGLSAGSEQLSNCWASTLT
jgi:WXG100 family type VII secretion target